MPRYRFYTLDVFTDTPFGGNRRKVRIFTRAIARRSRG
jgi:predicted PhzF superfamily epimerase YddE/YHI9